MVDKARKKVAKREKPKIEPFAKPEPPAERVQREKQVPLFKSEPKAGPSQLPTLALLDASLSSGSRCRP